MQLGAESRRQEHAEDFLDDVSSQVFFVVLGKLEGFSFPGSLKGLSLDAWLLF